MWIRIILCTILYATQLAAQPSLLWRTNYNSPANSAEVPVVSRVDAAGNLYIAGDLLNASDFDIVALKFSPSGALLWSAIFAGPDPGNDRVNDAALDSSGNLYIAGTSFSVPTSSDVVVLKVSPSGSFLWTNRFNIEGGSPSIDEAQAIGLDSNGDISVGGTGREGVRRRVFLAKLTPDGGTIWTTNYSSAATNDILAGMAVDPATGATYATIRNEISGMATHLFVKFNASGRVEWTRDSNEAVSLFDESRSSVLVSMDAGIYFTLQSQSRPALWKFDSSGNLVWKSVYNGSPAAMPHGAVVDAFGNVTYAASNIVAHVNRLGMLEWAARMRDNAEAALSLDALHTPYARALLPSRPAMLLTRFETNGAQRWIQFTPVANGITLAGPIVTTNGACYTTEAEHGSADWDIFAARYAAGAGNLGPVILSLSSGRALPDGSNTTLQVIASGSGLLQYQWFYRGEPLPGANASALNLTVATNTSGSYWVEVTDANGTTSSPEVPVGVIVPAAAQVTVMGGNAIFNPVVLDLLPRSIRWRFGGAYLPGQTNPILRLTNVAATAAGIYTAEIDDGLGHTNLITATLSVSDQVQLAWVVKTNATPGPTLDMALDGAGSVGVLIGRRFDYDLNVFDTSNGAVRSIYYNNDGFTAKLLRADSEHHFYVGSDYDFGGTSGSAFAARFPIGGGTPLWKSRAVTVARYAPIAAMLPSPLEGVYLLQSIRGGPLSPGSGPGINHVIATNADVIFLELHGGFEPLFTAQDFTFASSNEFAVVSRALQAGVATNFITRLDTNGVLIWKRTFVPDRFSPGLSLVRADASGDVFAAGAGSLPHSYIAIKWSAAGDLLWSIRVIGPQDTNAPAQGPAGRVDADGNLLLTGSSGSVKIDSAGNIKWVNAISGAALELDDQGNAYVGGRTFKEDGTSDLFVAKLTTNGVVRWQAQYNDEANSSERFGGIAVEPQGVVYLCGFGASLFVAKYVERSSSSAPVISQVPENRRVTPGSGVTLQVPFTGDTSGLTFRWYRDGEPFPDATNGVLNIPAFQAGHVGVYSLRIQNAFGWTISPDIWLTLPLVLSGATHDPVANRQSFTFPADRRYEYEVQATSTLTQWTSRATYFGTNAQINYADISTNTDRSFYRVLMRR